jgi:hypothetical protein
MFFAPKKKFRIFLGTFDVISSSVQHKMTMIFDSITFCFLLSCFLQNKTFCYLIIEFSFWLFFKFAKSLKKKRRNSTFKISLNLQQQHRKEQELPEVFSYFLLQTISAKKFIEISKNFNQTLNYTLLLELRKWRAQEVIKICCQVRDYTIFR